MKGVRLIAAALCALLVLAVPVMADGFGMGDFDSDTVNKNPQVDNPNEVTPTPSTEPPQEPTGDGAGNNAGDADGTNSAGTENGNSSQLDDGLWGDWRSFTLRSVWFLIQISVPNVAERMSSDKSLLNL